MDAREAYSQTGCLFCASDSSSLDTRGLPAGTEFGVDLRSWQITDRFRGLKLIPPGPHFFFTSASSLPTAASSTASTTSTSTSHSSTASSPPAAAPGSTSHLTDETKKQHERHEQDQTHGEKEKEEERENEEHEEEQKEEHEEEELLSIDIRSVADKTCESMTIAHQRTGTGATSSSSSSSSRRRKQQNTSQRSRESTHHQEEEEEAQAQQQEEGEHQEEEEEHQGEGGEQQRGVLPSSPPSDYAPRCGVWLWIQPGSVHSLYWQTAEERFESTTEARIACERDHRRRTQREACEQAVRSFAFDSVLGVYPAEECAAWPRLTCFITQAIIERIQPVGGVISSTAHREKADSSTRVDLEDAMQRMRLNAENARSAESEAERRQREIREIEESLCPKPGSSGLFFSSIPQRLIPPSAKTPAEITLHSLDKSYLLEECLRRHFQNDHQALLGELQFAFLSFALAQVLEGFEHWKNLVQILCSCDRLLSTMPRLFADFAVVLVHQLALLPEDFFVDVVTGNNFLVDSLQSFFELIQDDPSLHSKLRAAVALLRETAERHFGVVFGDLDSEDAPVIVHL